MDAGRLVEIARARLAALTGMAPEQLPADRPLAELGLDSVRGVELALLLQQELGVRFDPALWLNLPTLADLAAHVAAGPAGGVARAVTRVEGTSSEVSLQERQLWRQCATDPGDPASYHLFVPLRRYGPLDVDALDRCFRTLIGRHDALRTGFVATDDGPSRRVVDEAPFRIEELDLGGLRASARPAAVTAACDLARGAPFDLARPPLLRVTVVRLGPGQALVLVVVHHLVADGFSLGILRRELGVLYPAAAEGRPLPALAALPLRLLDHAAASAAALREGSVEGPLPPSRPLDVGLPPGPGPDVDRVAAVWDAELVAALRGLCSARRLTPSMVLLVAFEAALHRRVGPTAFTLVRAGRADPDRRGVVGLFAAGQTLATTLAPAATWGGLLDRARRVVAEEPTFAELARHHLAGPAAPRILLNLHPEGLDGDGTGPFVPAPGLHPYPCLFAAQDLMLQVFPVRDQLLLDLHLRPSAVRRATAVALADGVRAAVTELLADPASPAGV